MNGMKNLVFLYEALTGKIVEACFEISAGLGCGFLESVYQNALWIALEQSGLTSRREVSLDVRFHGRVVGHFFADSVVEDKVILKLKAVKDLAPEHFAQTINYLNGTGMEVDVLINFGQPILRYRRLKRKKDFNNLSRSSCQSMFSKE